MGTRPLQSTDANTHTKKNTQVLCKLLAAAAWKLHFDDEAGATTGGTSTSVAHAAAGRHIKRVLLRCGACTEPALLVEGLLGVDALLEEGRGRVPNFESNIYQDIELLD